jgi:hypothetical protein
MGIARTVSILVPSDKISVYFATTHERADKIVKWGFREGVRLKVTDDEHSPGRYENTQSCFEITLPESVIAKYEIDSFANAPFLRPAGYVETPREWKVPTEILNSYPLVRMCGICLSRSCHRARHDKSH